FPKKIWQSGSQSTRENWAEQTETWTSMNEDWNHEWLTDADDTNTLFVEDSFQGRPALLTFWRDLNVPVLRAEFVRYLTMLAKGGVYSDVDTSCIKPIEEWIPSRFDDQIINAVIGIEYDDSTSNMFGRPVNFCQRTMMAKPRHPIFEAVVARVVYHFEYLARIQNTDLAGLEVEEKEVLEATGPGAFTDAVMESLSNAMGRKVEWSEIQDLQEPKLFGDVLILPINAFGSGQMHSHSSDPAYGDVLAQHQSGESW
ncbi:glycosyltransferase family 32 protein, partial [Cadophora sp. DSE1049]